MKQLTTSKRMSRVFQGLVIALALVLVACGGDADDPTPTAPSGAGQDALPTVPSLESTPGAEVSEDEITVLQPEAPATAEASPPDMLEDVATPDDVENDVDDAESVSTPGDLPADLTQSDDPADIDVASPPGSEEGEIVVQPTSSIVGVASPPSVGDATPPADVPDAPVVTDDSTPVATAAEDMDTEPTERARTGEETFDHPGDGTGGSGMPGELNANDEDVDEVGEPSASPEASPIAQLSIAGCDVPDVPGFLGDNSTVILTADVNFRSGPGVECDPLLDEALGEGQTVEIIGGPVTQSDDDSEWIQIEIDGEPGWITTEFIEPAE